MKSLNLLVLLQSINLKNKSSTFPIHKATTYTSMILKISVILKNHMKGLIKQINVIRIKAILQKTEFIYHSS